MRFRRISQPAIIVMPDSAVGGTPPDWLDPIAPLLAGAPDLMLWFLDDVRERAANNINEKERLIKEEVGPLFKYLGPVAADGYTKEAARRLEVGIKALKELLSASSKARDENPAPPPLAPSLEAGHFDVSDEGAIVRTARGLEIVRLARREGATFLEPLFSAHIDVERRIVVEGEGEVLDLRLRCPQTGVEAAWRVHGSVFASRLSFKERLPSVDFGLVGGSDNDLQRLALHLSRQSAPKIRGVRVLGPQRIDGEWVAVFSDLAVRADGSVREDVTFFADGDTGVKWCVGGADS